MELMSLGYEMVDEGLYGAVIDEVLVVLEFGDISVGGDLGIEEVAGHVVDVVYLSKYWLEANFEDVLSGLGVMYGNLKAVRYKRRYRERALLGLRVFSEFVKRAGVEGYLEFCKVVDEYLGDRYIEATWPGFEGLYLYILRRKVKLGDGVDDSDLVGEFDDGGIEVFDVPVGGSEVVSGDFVDIDICGELDFFEREVLYETEG